jgi:uncharacterized protein (UPF0261 family)
VTQVRTAKTRLPFEELSAAQRRRRLVGTLLRPAILTTVLVVAYYVLPLDRTVDSGTIAVLVLGLASVAGVLALQIMQIMKSDYPRLRAIGAMGTTLPLFLVIFASTYYLIAQGNAGAFTEPLTRTDSLYFTVTVFSTVGFGDIAPKLEAARIIAMIQMIGDLVLIGVIGRLILSAVSHGVARKAVPPE